MYPRTWAQIPGERNKNSKEKVQHPNGKHELELKKITYKSKK